MTTTASTGRAETIAQVLILLLIAGMAGAASFTHVHDWTMHNAPRGTGTWFGWANAVISELTPTAAGIEIRRRKRHHHSIAYPMGVLIAAAVLSLAAQVAEARPTIAGWISSAVPALAFLALTKLILGRPAAKTGEPPCAMTASKPPASAKTMTAPATATTGTNPSAGGTGPKTPAPPADGPTPTPAAAPAAATLTPEALTSLQPVPSGQLLISARMTAFAHQQATGQPITPGQLAERLTIPPALAESLLDHLGGTPPPVTAINGTPVHAEGRP
jgi:hypothetical protein